MVFEMLFTLGTLDIQQTVYL